MKICLYGSGSRKTEEIYIAETYRLGAEMAKRGHTLVFGGGDTGMMGACARGVHDAGGKSIGIAPEWIGRFEPLCEECSEFIYVDTMDERKKKFLENSDAFIISPGGIGTLDEFFEVITLNDTMLKMIDEMGEKGFLYKQMELYKVASGPDEIFEYLDD